jgi:outer membrane protein assembly factor BamB
MQNLPAIAMAASCLVFSCSGGDETPTPATDNAACEAGETCLQEDAEGTDGQAVPEQAGGDTAMDAAGETGLVADAAEEASPPPEPPPLDWNEPLPWKTPLADYVEWVRTEKGLAFSDYDHALKELAVFDDRLYVGYGDWTNNLGPVDIRYLTADGEMTKEFTIEEESIDYYRPFGTSLYIPGVDASEDALVGNVFYKRSGKDWVKVRKLEHCLHVLDVFEFDGTLYACGSGNTDMDAYYKMDDMAVLWRSDDGGDNWQLELEWHDEILATVARWERFVRTGDNFYVLGQYMDQNLYTFKSVPRRFDSGQWTEVELLPTVMVQHTYQLDQDTGIVRGADLDEGWRSLRAFAVEAGETTVALTFFDDRDEAVLDFVQMQEGQGLFLTRESASFEKQLTVPYAFHVYYSHDLVEFTELVAWESSTDYFLSLAWWQGNLYFGTWRGELYVATPK